MRKIHLFYIQSNFHALVAGSIINQFNLPVEDVFYVLQRNVTKPHTGNLLFDESGLGFTGRLKFYFNHKNELKQLLRDSYVCAYFPFDFNFPFRYYYNEYVFYEEGLSSYSVVTGSRGAMRYISTLVKNMLSLILFPFVHSNIKGFLLESCNIRKYPSRKTKLISFKDDAYSVLDHKNIYKKVVSAPCQVKCSHISNSYILVLDRLSAAGRPYSLENYIETMDEVFKSLNMTDKKLYVKQHPADSGNVDTKRIICDMLNSQKYEYEFFSGSLEEIAIEDKSNTFVGSNSTLLFYAPIWGKTNKSISFVNILAKKDALYRRFLDNWGGLDSFCDLFSKYVKCL